MHDRPFRRPLASAVAALLALAATQLHAQGISDLDLPAQPLAESIRVVARQSNLNILVDPRLVEGRQAPAIQKPKTAEQALAWLLAGTGLTARFVDEKTVALVAADGTTTRVSSKERTTATQGKERPLALAQAESATDDNRSVASETNSDAGRSRDPRIEIQEIIVTGSRLRLNAQEGAQQVDVYTREEIQRSGQGTVAGFLNTQKEFGPGIQGEQSFQAFADGTTVQLRALPVGTTLVLINGRRAPSTQLVSGQFFNLNTIPAAAVERIEVLPQGSSAIYGSDALAGVVNVILRKDIEGMPVDVTYGYADGTDDLSASLAWGTHADRAAFSLIGSYYDRSMLAVKERELTANTDFRRFGGADRRTTNCNPGNVSAVTGNLNGLGTPNAAIPAGLSGRPNISDFTATAGQTNRCNNRFDRALIIPTERAGVMANASYEFSPSAKLDSEFMYSRVEETVLLAGGILAGVTVPATNPFNPFGQAVRVSYRLPADLAPIQNDYTSHFYRGVVALSGALFGSWDYNVSGWMSRDDTRRPFTTSLDDAAVAAALNSTDPNTALNVFTSGAPASQAVIDGLFLPRGTLDYVGQTTGATALFRGGVIQLPAGAVETALGVEYYRDELSVDTHPTPQTTDFSFSRNVKAVFAEARLPLLEGNRDAAMLALTGALRYDDYSDFGSATTPQLGLELRPLADLLIHASYGEAFRAPVLTNIYGLRTFGDANLLAAVTDPRRNGEQVRPAFVSGANPDLQPETGESRAAGITWRGVEGLEVSATWWQINQSDRINAGPSPQTIVDNEAIFPGRITRGPATGGLPGPITRIDFSAANFGELETAGIDFEVSYSFDTAWGEWTPAIEATRVYHYESQLVPTAAVVNNLGKINTDVWAPEWRGSVGVNWRLEHLSAGLTGRYIGEYLDRVALPPPSGRVQELGDFFIWDVSVRYELGDALGLKNELLSGAYVAFGATDVLDEGPQFAATSEVGYEPSTYDIRGRYVFASVGLRF